MEIYSGALGHLGESQVFSVKVNGEDVFVEKYNDLHIGWFGADEDVLVEIEVSESIQSYRLSPTAHGIPHVVDGDKLSFTLDEPTQLMLWEVNSLDDRLLIIADKPDSDKPTSYTNIMSYDVDATGQTDDTVKIQNAINETTGVLYFPAGCYRANGLNLKSNLVIYLDAGARLKAWDGSSLARFLWGNNDDNIHIKGRGIIDGNARTIFNISFWDCNNASVEGLCFNPNKHPIEVANESRNVYLKNFYGVTTTTSGGGTGIHLTGCHDVRLENIFTYSMDDGIAIGTVGYMTPYPQYNVSIKNYTAFLHAYGAPLKFYTNYGHETIADGHDFKVENVYVIRTDTVFAWYSVCGSSLYNIQVDNVFVEKNIGEIFEIEVYDSPDSWWTGQYDCCRNEDDSWDGIPGTIHNAVINNVICEEQEGETNDIGYYGQTGIAHDVAIYDIDFKNIVIAGKRIGSLDDARFRAAGSSSWDGRRGLKNVTFYQNFKVVENN